MTECPRSDSVDRRHASTSFGQYALGRSRWSGSDVDGSSIVDLTVTPDPGTAVLREWDQLVDAVPGSDVAQLSAWARIRQNAGYRPLYLLSHLDGQLAGGALVLERQLPIVGRFGYVSNGPLVSPDVPREPVLDRLLTAMDSLARTELRALFVQPPIDGQDVSAGLRNRGFRASAAGIAPAASVRVDLRREAEDIRRSFAKANRSRTRSSGKRGVTVRTGSIGDLGLVADLLARTAEHQEFEPLSLEYIQRLYGELDVDGHVVLFVAELDGVPVAALLCTLSGGTVKQRISGMDRSEAARRAGVSAARVWYAMLWAKSHGCDSYDFGGIRADAAHHLLAGDPASRTFLTGAEQFKTSFGGEVLLYPDQVELISSAPLRLAYAVAQRTHAGRRAVSVVKRSLRGGTRLGKD